jgi:signal transduction histidine kinase
MMADLDDQPGPVRVPRFGLSGKLLVLTILFVMIAEVLIYVPSVSQFRLNWLNDRLAAARTAALVLYAAPSGMVPEDLARDILSNIGAQAVVMKTGQTRRLLAVSEMPSEIHRDFDMRDVTWWEAIAGAYHGLTDPRSAVLRIVGHAPRDGEYLEILIQNAPLQRAMLRFSTNVLIVSLIISASTLALVYLALHFLFVRPMRRITRNIMAFRADPENPSRTLRVSKRNDEIGVTERELASMQSNLTSMLHQRSRLAALGLAVSKINHDLRNMLASAQLVSDQLSTVRDPRVQRFAPKLLRALERAIELCQSTLSYGRAQEAPPVRKMVALEPLVEDVRENLGLQGQDNIGWIVSIERGIELDADHDQLFRVLLNLARNAVQALTARAPNDALRDQVRITGRREGGVVVIEVADTGPGFSSRAREHLFEAFSGSTRPGGTGLGLAIAAELVRAHGGEIRLVEGTIGATFRITIPDRAVDLDAHRSARARA